MVNYQDLIVYSSLSLLNISFNPFHPNISLHILYTVLCTFPMVFTRKIELLGCVIISFILITLTFDSVVIL